MENPGAESKSHDDEKWTWSNMECIRIAFKDSFPTPVRDLNVQKNVINRYFNFYLGAKLKAGLTVTDLTFAVIAIMPAHDETEAFIWDDAYYKDDGTLFFLTAEDKLKAEIAEIPTVKEEKKEQAADAKETNVNKNGESFKENVKIMEFENEDNVPVKENSTAPASKVDDNKEKQETTIKENKVDNNVNQNNEQPKPSDPLFGAKGFASSFPTTLKWYSRPPRAKVIEKDQPKYGPLENAAFTASCNKLLEDWDHNQKARIILKYFFGIVALTSLRGTTKKYTHLDNTFRSNKFLTNISFVDEYLKYSNPHKKFVKKCYSTFSKRDGKIPIMFAKIVINSFHVDSVRREHGKALKPTLNIFKLTVLAHTVDYGFGLVNLFQNIESQSGSSSISRIAEATYCDVTAESWKRLREFLERYVSSTSKETTHHWARVISTDYFKNLSCSTNYELAVILAIFIEKLTNNEGIWQSTWVGIGSVENLAELKDRGYKMYAAFNEENLLRENRKKSNEDVSFDLDENDEVQKLINMDEFLNLDDINEDVFGSILHDFIGSIYDDFDNDDDESDNEDDFGYSDFL